MWKYDEKHWYWRIDVISWPSVLTYFCWSDWKITCLGKASRENSGGIWSYDMEKHARKCVERYCELADKKVEQLHKVSNPCLDDHQFKQEELESVGEFAKVCSQICLAMLVLGTNWTTWHSVVSQQTGTISHQMGRSPYQHTHRSKWKMHHHG